jgi:hypothetical protein
MYTKEIHVHRKMNLPAPHLHKYLHQLATTLIPTTAPHQPRQIPLLHVQLSIVHLH